MTIDPVWGWAVLLGVLGLVFGSFIATLAIRWPEGRAISRGRSECDSCGRGLRAGELVPVMSYVLQRGRCRGCGAPIRMGHVLTELVGGAIGVAAAIASPDPAGAAGAAFGWLLLTLAALDVAALWLPNALTGLLAAAGLATGLAGLDPPLDARLIGGVAGFGVLWLVAWGYKRLRGRQGLGGGDPKLFGGIGLWLGWQALPLVLLAACLIGLAGVLGLMLGGRRVTATDRLPFGVMLAAAAFAVWLGLAIGPMPGQARARTGEERAMRNMMLGVLLGVLAANGAMAQDKSDDATIQVLGVGTVEEAPTIAHISFKLRGEGKGSDDALRALVARKEAVARDMGALAEAKFRLETGDVEIHEVRGRDCRGASQDEDTPRLSTGACAVLGYVATMEASVDVSPVALAGTLSGLASRAGASEVRLSRFRTADPRAAQQRAMAAAVANGQEQALAIAAASGAKLGRLVRVSDPNGGYVIGEQLQRIAATGSRRNVTMDAPVAVEIAPQAITTTARLVLVYEIAR